MTRMAPKPRPRLRPPRRRIIGTPQATPPPEPEVAAEPPAAPATPAEEAAPAASVAPATPAEESDEPPRLRRTSYYDWDTTEEPPEASRSTSSRRIAYPAEPVGNGLLAELEATELYSEELGIDLASGDEAELFKWFLACLLFGSPVSQRVATGTYRSLDRYHLTDPHRVVAASWAFLVDPVLREGGYVKDAGRKATQLQGDCQALLDAYHGSLQRLHEVASDPLDLERRLEGLGAVGAISANFFLRELRPYWSKADPEPLNSVVDVAWKVGIDLGTRERATVGFTRLEAGLCRRRQELLGTRRIRRRTSRMS